ncbi:glycoside hydrolase, partial [Haematococcus lacustris]
MEGGYLQDRWVQGWPSADTFNQWRWEAADVFVYFSHQLVTLPPPGWVTAARQNGVKVLGTLITEGPAGRRSCERLFASEAAADRTAHQLAALAHYHGFDGWLVNIENHLGCNLLPHLLRCLRRLRLLLRERRGPDALLIWWTKRSIQGMAALAGERAADVWLGVDVFGRGTYGGGKDHTDVGVEAALAAGLSVALFAPGWTWECFPSHDFAARADAWWDKVSAAWHIHPAGPLPRQSLAHRRAHRRLGAGALKQPAPLPPPTPPASGAGCGFQTWPEKVWALPLVTSFCTGQGQAGFWVEGVRVSACPWSRLGLQELLPPGVHLG